MTLICARPGCERPVKRTGRKYCSLGCTWASQKWADYGKCVICGAPLSRGRVSCCSKKCAGVLFSRQSPPSPHGAAVRERLAELWSGPLSSAAIAREVGLSKNQVIGLVHRMGLPGRTPPRNFPPRVAKPWPPQPPRAPPVTLPPLRPQPVERPKVAVVVPFPAPPSLFRTCQFIEGDDRRTWQMCGGPTRLGSAYCQHHHTRCYHRRPLSEAAA